MLTITRFRWHLEDGMLTRHQTDQTGLEVFVQFTIAHLDRGRP